MKIHFDPTTLHLSALLLRKNIKTGLTEKLCPACLAYNSESINTCTACGNEIGPNNEDRFWQQRLAHKQFKEASIGIVNPETTTHEEVKKLFAEQFSLTTPLFEAACFINRYSLTKIDLLDIFFDFVQNFPLNKGLQDLFHTMKSDLNLPQEEVSSIVAKLVELEKKIPMNLYKSLAHFVQNYVDDSKIALSLQAVQWLNIEYGYYMSEQKMKLTLDESSSADLQKVFPLLAIPHEAYGFEWLLSPLHWRNLAAEKVAARPTLRISLPRYKFILDQWFPSEPSDKAWRDLGLAYCKGSATSHNLTAETLTYLSQQRNLPWETRDISFVFSYAILFNDFKKEDFNLSQLTESYYAPLVGYLPDPSFVDEVLKKTLSPETKTRILSYLDLTQKSDSADEAGEQMIAGKSDSDIIRGLNNMSLQIKQVIFDALLKKESIKVLQEIFMSEGFVWDLRSSKINLKAGFEISTDVAYLLGRFMHLIEPMSFADWLKALENLDIDPGAVEEITYKLRNSEKFENDFDISLIFKAWINADNRGDLEKAPLFFKEIAPYFKGPIPLKNRDLKDKLKARLPAFVEVLKEMANDSSEKGLKRFEQLTQSHLLTESVTSAEQAREQILAIP